MTTAVSSDPFAALAKTSSASSTSSTKTSSTSTSNSAKAEPGAADRFLKMLVTQLQNQDPLNPMDNAQITSQMAQINTVNGIETLNAAMLGLNGQFVQMQALQGAALVGHDITVQGNRVALDGTAGAEIGSGGFELAGTADQVKLEILNPAGRVVDTLNLGAQAAGRHGFEWAAKNVADGADYRFRVSATNGTAAVSSTSLMRDQVQAVSTSSGSLLLQTRHSGDVPYGDVKAFN